MKKIIVFWVCYLLCSAVPALAETACQATLSSDLRLHVPVIKFDGNYYWADFNYVPSSDGAILFNLVAADALSVGDCDNPALLWVDQDANAINLHIPSIQYSGVDLWADFQYTAGPFLKVTDASVPLSIKPAKDTSSTVTATISAEQGGVVTASGNDGSVFTLSIPANALATDTVVSLTPVTSIQGLSTSGGMLAGVELEPAGLSFLLPATLTITLTKTVDQSQIIGIGYAGSKNEVFLDSANVSGSVITLSLNHFSGRVVITGNQQDSNAISSHKPSNAEDRAAQETAAALKNAKESGQSLDDSELVNKLVAIHLQWYKSGVKPAIDSAVKDDSQLPCAAAEYLRWKKNIELLGLDTQFKDEIQYAEGQLQTALKNAFQNSLKRCVNNRDPEEGATIVALAKAAALLFGNDLDFWGALKKCLRFEVTFDSTISAAQAYTETHFNVTTVAELDNVSSQYGLIFKGPVQSASLVETMSIPQMPVNTSNVPATFSLNGDIDGLFSKFWGKPLVCGDNKKTTPTVPPISMNYTINVGDATYFGQPGMSQWWGAFDGFFHKNEQVDGPPGLGLYDTFAARDFVWGDGDVLFKKIYSQFASIYSEQTEITIKHKPLPLQ